MFASITPSCEVSGWLESRGERKRHANLKGPRIDETMGETVNALEVTEAVLQMIFLSGDRRP